MYTLLTDRDSRNFTPNHLVPGVFGRTRTIDSITIHWWGLREWKATFDGTVKFLCTNDKPTSAHEVIEAGKVAVIVSHYDAAWAAGNAVGNATSIHLELNPRGSEGDYATAAERIRDIRALHGKDLPLIPHRDWQATMCPGDYDLARLDSMSRSMTAQATTVQEDDMFTDQDRADLKLTLEKANRGTGVLDDIEVPLHEKLLDVNRWVKGDADPEQTVYELHGGKLRGITPAEWELLGYPEPAVFTQSVIDDFPKV